MRDGALNFTKERENSRTSLRVKGGGGELYIVKGGVSINPEGGGE